MRSIMGDAIAAGGHPSFLAELPPGPCDNCADGQPRDRELVQALFSHLFDVQNSNIQLQGGEDDDVSSAAVIVPHWADEVATTFISG